MIFIWWAHSGQTGMGTSLNNSINRPIFPDNYKNLRISARQKTFDMSDNQRMLVFHLFCGDFSQF